MKRWAKWLAVGLLGLVVLAWLGAWLASDPVPEGEPGPEADAFARALEQSVDLEAWRETPAVHFVFAGRHEHTWDRARGLSRVQWEEYDVVLDVSRRVGCAWAEGEPQRGDALEELLEGAHARFINDSFWLNPLGKLFDPGVERRLVDQDGETALLVTFTENGLTPGDSYLWLRGESGRPRAWRMWTSVLPIDGLEASWEDWKQLSTGAWISTKHAVSVVDLELSDVAAGASVEALPGVEGDPFARCDALSPVSRR